MEHRNITREQAITMGYTVDRHGYPWVAHKGPRSPLGSSDQADMFTIDTPGYSGTSGRILRVWHIPQVPGDAFHFAVNSIPEGKRVLDLLADYDQFQFDQGVKGDYCNAGGIEEFIDGEWIEIEDDPTDEEIEAAKERHPAGKGVLR